MNPLFVRQAVYGEKMTIARVSLGKGCSLPEHSHVHEQFSMVEKGRLRFRVGDSEVMLGAGEVLHIPSNVPHAVLEALEDCIVMDIFSPVREDWRAGDDAYLRR